MSPPAQKRWSITELLVVVAILGGLSALLYSALQQVRNPKGPHGELVPTAAPEEANRIVHATGLSIVAPKNWDQIRDEGPDVPFLCVAARGIPGGRLTSFITIHSTERPGETLLSGATRVSFQGFPAYERMAIDRASTFDDPARSTYSLYVDAAGDWWAITWVVADAVRELPPEIKKYIDTVRLPAAKPAKPAKPASEPTTTSCNIRVHAKRSA
jgi:hypothetical protein